MLLPVCVCIFLVMAFILCFLYARKRLQCWFFSALQYHMAGTYWYSSFEIARFFVLHVLAIKHYFDFQKYFFLFLAWGSLTAVIALPVLLFFMNPNEYIVLSAGMTVAFALLLITHLQFGRVKGAEGRFHEKFNRFAPLQNQDKIKVQNAARQVTETRLYGRWIKSDDLKTDLDIEQRVAELEKIDKAYFQTM